MNNVICSDFSDDLSNKEKQFPNVTGLLDGRIVVCLGLNMLFPYRAGAWMYLSRDAGYPVIMRIKLGLDEWIRDYGLVRVQALVKAEWEEGNRFVRWLGMSLEGTMRKFMDDSDMNLYARVK